MKPNVKLCWFCEHFHITMAEEGWSEYTPGADFHVACWKSQWIFDACGSEEQFRKCINTAVTCKHYELKPELVQIQAEADSP